MPNEQTTQDQVTDPKETQGQVTGLQPDNTEAKPRISDAEAKLLKENMKYKKRLEEIEAAEKTAQENALKEQGNYKALAEKEKAEKQTYIDKLKLYESHAQSEFDELMKSLPKEKLELIKDELEPMTDPIAKLSLIKRYQKLGVFGTAQSQAPDAAASGSNSQKLSIIDQKIKTLKERFAQTHDSNILVEVQALNRQRNEGK